MLAQGQKGLEILEHLTELSRPFGTTITMEEGVGIIRP